MQGPQSNSSIYMKYTAEKVGGEADLCRVRLVCRALWMTWISPLARLHHIVLVPKNWSNTKWISSQSFGAQSRDVASFSRGCLWSWKRRTLHFILFLFLSMSNSIQQVPKCAPFSSCAPVWLEEDRAESPIALARIHIWQVAFPASVLNKRDWR